MNRTSSFRQAHTMIPGRRIVAVHVYFLLLVLLLSSTVLNQHFLKNTSEPYVSNKTINQTPVNTRDATDLLKFTSKNPFAFPIAHTYPFPYFESRQVVHPDLYLALERDFPAVPHAVLNGSHAKGNKSIRRTDAAYAELLAESAAWRALDQFVYSQQMIDYGMQLFGPALRDDPRCKVDPDKAVFVDRNETLNARGVIPVKPFYERRSQGIGNPNELYIVMDFFHGPGNITGRRQAPYSFNRHLDWPFRVFSILLYFTDTNEETGGNLDIYDGTRIQSSYNISKNGGIAHLSPHPDAWHGVRTFTKKDDYRKLIQIQATSSWTVCLGD